MFDAEQPDRLTASFQNYKWTVLYGRTYSQTKVCEICADIQTVIVEDSVDRSIDRFLQDADDNTMFFEFNNSTVSSRNDKGDLYYSSFDFFPKYYGRCKYVYKGMIFGRGPKNERKCVVKLSRDHVTSHPDDWQTAINSAKAAQTIATVFNDKVLPKSCTRLKFRIPFTAMIDTVSSSYTVAQIIANCVGKNVKDCKPGKDEYVLVEDYIRGDFSRLSANNGWMGSNPAYRELQAFAHFTWCYSCGEIVVAGLKGVKTSSRYLLSSPLIHSRNQSFGDEDDGQTGIEHFFQRHQCNDICENWSKPFGMHSNWMTSWSGQEKGNELSIQRFTERELAVVTPEKTL